MIDEKLIPLSEILDYADSYHFLREQFWWSAWMAYIEGAWPFLYILHEAFLWAEEIIQAAEWAMLGNNDVFTSHNDCVGCCFFIHECAYLCSIVVPEGSLSDEAALFLFFLHFCPLSACFCFRVPQSVVCPGVFQGSPPPPSKKRNLRSRTPPFPPRKRTHDSIIWIMH